MANTDTGKGDLDQRSALIVEAWINTSMERDKSLLSISSAGVGLLVTLLSIDNSLGSCEVIFYSLAFLGFTLSIISIIKVFGVNKKYLELMVKYKENKSLINRVKTRLTCWDRTAVFSFGAALLSTVAIGILQLI